MRGFLRVLRISGVSTLAGGSGGPAADGRAARFGQARHWDLAGRGCAVIQATQAAVQAMNTAIATNWHVAAAQTKA